MNLSTTIWKQGLDKSKIFQIFKFATPDTNNCLSHPTHTGCVVDAKELVYEHDTEYTHLLCKGKYHCMVDLLFDWFGYKQTCKCVFNST